MKKAFSVATQLFSSVFVFWLIHRLMSEPTTDIGRADRLRACVSGIRTQRQSHTHYLAGHAKEEFDFNSFEQKMPLAEMQRRHLDSWSVPDLADYLQPGDSLWKAAYSPQLTVRRGTHITHWILGGFQPVPPDNPR